MKKLWALPVAALFAVATTISATAGADTLVSVGSPSTPFSQNKQNEPALAVDANHPNILAAGSNDEIDEEACNAGADTTCPFTAGIGVSGIYFSFDSGHSWVQPTYANLTSSAPTASGEQAFRGFEAIAVSRTDDVTAAAASVKSAWMPPVLISRQSSTTFSDKEQIWADNASSSRFFGNVYVCWASFVGQELSPNAAPAQLQVAVSRDGGTTWTQHPIGAAANNSQRNPMDGCTVRTDSNGNAYVFGVGTQSSGGHQAFEFVSISSDGGATWSAPRTVAGPVTQPGVIDPILGRPTIDGIAGARSDLAPAPSVDIANGAPTGADATDRMVLTYVSGSLATPHVYFTESGNGGATWSTPRAIETAGDRGYYTAPAISPDGTDVYVVYNAFTTPYRTNTTDPRNLVGVVLHADVSANATGAFTELNRGANGDPRGSSQNNLVGEFLGDYVYAVATRTYGAAVWNDARNAGDCSAIDAWRMSLRNGTTVARPAPQQDCPANFGNSDIFGGSYPDPTPT